MRFWSRWRERRRTRKRDRQAFAAMMAMAPSGDQQAASLERLAEVEAMAVTHGMERARRAELAADSAWGD